MQTAQIIKSGSGTKWAVIPPWSHSKNKHEKDIPSCDRAVEVTLVDDRHYNRNAYTRKDPSDFYTTGEKAFSLLVTFEQNGEQVYAVIPPSHFMGEWSAYEGYWIPERARRQQAEAERQAKQAIEQEKREKRYAVEREHAVSMQAESDRLAESLRETVTAMLGVRGGGVTIYPQVKGEWRNLDTEYETYAVTQSGTVTMEMGLFQKLLEKAMN